MPGAETSIVRVGIAGDLILDAAKLTHHCTKAGGRPIFPGSTPPDGAADIKCLVCDSRLSLIVQALWPPSGPQNGVETAACILLIFGCTAAGCGVQPGSWRAWTLLLPQQPISGASAPAVPQPAQPAAQTTTEDWGIDSSEDWGGEAGSSSAAQGGADLAEELQASLDRLLLSSGGHEQAKRKPATRERGGSAAGQACTMSELPQLPEFQLHWELESAAPEAPRLQPGKQQHIAELLAQYEREEGSLQAGEASAPEAAEGTWAGEGYEKASALSPDAAFHKFAKRLQRRPDQCVRAAPELLWPKSKAPEPERCRRCGSDIELQAQLMAPLMPMFEEAAEWLAQCSGPGAGGHVDAPVSWDWLTVAVFACRGCTGEAAGVLQEATVMLANEDA